jgi:hypothetical protein
MEANNFQSFEIPGGVGIVDNSPVWVRQFLDTGD